MDFVPSPNSPKAPESVDAFVIYALCSLEQGRKMESMLLKRDLGG